MEYKLGNLLYASSSNALTLLNGQRMVRVLENDSRPEPDWSGVNERSQPEGVGIAGQRCSEEAVVRRLDLSTGHLPQFACTLKVSDAYGYPDIPGEAVRLIDERYLEVAHNEGVLVIDKAGIGGKKRSIVSLGLRKPEPERRG